MTYRPDPVIDPPPAAHAVAGVVPPSRVAAALRLVVIPAIVVIALVVGWRLGYFDLDRRQELLGVVQRLRVMPGVAIAFVAVFAVLITLCLPAYLGTLLGGAIFGPWIGALVALAGSLTATVLAYWLARSVARRPLERLFGTHRLLRELKEHDGVMRLFRLRVMPIAPFAVLAYLAGLAGVSMRRLLAATLLGSLPTSLAYAFVGAAVLEGLVSSSDGSKRALWIAGAVTVVMFVVSVMPSIVRRLRD